MLSIPFHFDTPYGRFADALHFAEDHGLTEEQIAALKQQRLDNWIALITAPPPQE
jgi:hypothetical protein